jgi:hypothetical protein
MTLLVAVVQGAVGQGSTTAAMVETGCNGTASSITGTSVTTCWWWWRRRGQQYHGSGWDRRRRQRCIGIGLQPRDLLNTGGGGGGGVNQAAGSGGSGVVIIKIPSSYSAIFSSGVTQTLSTSVVGFNIYTVTATSTTSETVAFYANPSVDFLVVAGGGGGGAFGFGGGGAGGYREFSAQN